MTIGIGIALSFVAMLAWGFGDFLLQKSTRKVGTMETLFFISLFGSVILLPFSLKSFAEAFSNMGFEVFILAITSVLLLCAAILDLEALKRGKLAVVEPIWSLEIPVASVLAFFIISERISLTQIILIALLVVFLVMVAFKEKRFSKKTLLEKGVLIAIFSAIAMGATNFFFGWGARATDPILINFVTDTFLMLASGIYLLSVGKWKSTMHQIKENIGVILPPSIADKISWLAFAFSMAVAPISVAVALSESYIIIAVILGITVNKEKLHSHQKIGLIGAVIVAVILAIITTN